jgi:hypothetical protein
VPDSYYNLVSAASRGPGVYALLAGTTIPHVATVSPSAATNDVTTTLVISGGYFLPPVEVALLGPTATYTLPLLSISPYSLTAVVTQGLPAREYGVRVVNGDGGASPSPGIFALYDPAPGCFYDFFESGASKWQLDGAWGIAILPSGERVMTDSPTGPYLNAGDYGSGQLTHTTAITSEPFGLSEKCANPTLTFQHDYVIARVGSSEDVGRVEISTDDGLIWTELSHYSGGGVYTPVAEDTPSPEWANANWQNVIINLSAYTGTVRLRFSLEVDQTVSDKGWVLNNVMVKSGVATAPPPIFLPIIRKQ